MKVDRTVIFQEKKAENKSDELKKKTIEMKVKFNQILNKFGLNNDWTDFNTQCCVQKDIILQMSCM